VEEVMPPPEDVLQQIRVAAPCPARWEAMQGDEQVRFCAGCEKHVYNLSAMNAAEAAELVDAHEGRLCVRFFRRDDGTMLTNDCPVGLAALRQRLKRRAMLTAGMLVACAVHLLALIGLGRWQQKARPSPEYATWGFVKEEVEFVVEDELQDLSSIYPGAEEVGFLMDPPPPALEQLYVPKIEGIDVHTAVMGNIACPPTSPTDSMRCFPLKPRDNGK
jgi:hypothetical protein